MSQIDIFENAILVTAGVVGLYHSILQKAGLKALNNASKKIEQKHFYWKIKMAEFVLKNNFFNLMVL